MLAVRARALHWESLDFELTVEELREVLRGQIRKYRQHRRTFSVMRVRSRLLVEPVDNGHAVGGERLPTLGCGWTRIQARDDHCRAGLLELLLLPQNRWERPAET